MPENESQSKVQESVLESIKQHRVTMRSKKYFFLHAALLAVGIAILFLACLYLASFILFGLIRSGVWFVPAFGLWGWLVFFRSLPWILILLTLVFALILEVMVRRYSFAYRRPLLYSMLGIVILVLVGAFVISRLRFHEGFRQYNRAHHVPMVGGFYRRFGNPQFRDIHRGMVRGVSSSSFILESEDGVTSTVFITSGTRLFRSQGFSASDTVVVFGDNEGRLIQAIGIKNIEE